nr:alpha-(1,3)-fucosyltransferase 6-like [Vanessa tameamea]
MWYLRVLFKKFVSFNTYFLLIVLCLCLLLIYKLNINLKSAYMSEIHQPELESHFHSDDHSHHIDLVNNFYSRRKDWQTSNLGSLMFKNDTRDFELTKDRENRTYVILIWRYWKWLQHRHVENFGSKRKSDPLSACSVHNCKFTGEDSKLSSADAVIIHIQRGVFPNTTKRNAEQRWVFLSDESPIHAFSMASVPPKMSDLANIFNWSMTYRSDSDVPVPYGRTVALKKPILSQITYEHLKTLVPYWNDKSKDILATILISNCAVSRRMAYLKKMQEYLTVDVYGKCSENHKESCPGHFRSDCNLMSKYLFYLVFENSLCEEYLTEKLFYHAYSKGAIPVIMGSTVDICKKLLPPNSFLHVDNYKEPKELANHILDIGKDDKTLLSYHEWRNDFEVLNEHGYFGSKSYHLCRICEALNYNDAKTKIYDEENLRIFFDPELSCR